MTRISGCLAIGTALALGLIAPSARAGTPGAANPAWTALAATPVQYYSPPPPPVAEAPPVVTAPPPGYYAPPPAAAPPVVTAPAPGYYAPPPQPYPPRAESVPPAPTPAAYGYMCYAGHYTCSMPEQTPVGTTCTCPGIGAPSYGTVR